MATINTDQLDKINEQIEGVLSLLDSYFEEIQKEIDAAPKIAASIAQEKCDELSVDINLRGAAIRQKCINFLKPQLAKIKEKISPILPIVSIIQEGISADFGAIIDTLIVVLQILVAPYQPYMDLLTELPPKLLQLSSNLSKLATYSPDLDMPEGVPQPSMSVNIEPITMEDIS